MKSIFKLLITLTVILTCHFNGYSQCDSLKYQLDSVAALPFTGGYVGGQNSLGATASATAFFGMQDFPLHAVALNFESATSPDSNAIFHLRIYEFDYSTTIPGKLLVSKPVLYKDVARNILLGQRTYVVFNSVIVLPEVALVAIEYDYSQGSQLAPYVEVATTMGFPPPQPIGLERDSAGNWYYTSFSVGTNMHYAPQMELFTCGFNTTPQIDLNVTPACHGMGGMIEVFPLFGNPPYIYLWNTGDTSNIIQNVGEGKYYLSIIDSSSTQRNFEIKIPLDPACIGVITGKIYFDKNNNCQFDSSDLAKSNALLYSPSGGGEFTDLGGNFLYVIPAGTYTISVPPLLDHIFPCFSGMDTTVVVNMGDTIILDFPLQFIPRIDLKAISGTAIARPGFNYNFIVGIKNLGNIEMPADVEVSLSPKQTFLGLFQGQNSFPVYYTYDSIDHKISWTTPILQPNELINYRIHTKLAPPPDLNIGDVISYKTTVSTNLNEPNLRNNVDSINVTLQGSYDPNEKHVTPVGVGPTGIISQDDTIMKYTILFQNTGTDTAFTVVIRDTLDLNLNVFSIEPSVSSHPYTVRIENENVLIFTFDNILLPDSHVNEPKSHGQVIFYIHQKPGLPLKTAITNSVGIYFDYNLPVITNTVLNTIDTIPGDVSIYSVGAAEVKIYPNPASGYVVIESQTEGVDLQIIDLLGRTVAATSVSSGKTVLSVEHLKSGLHVVQLTSKEGIQIHQKLLIVR